MWYTLWESLSWLRFDSDLTKITTERLVYHCEQHDKQFPKTTKDRSKMFQYLKHETKPNIDPFRQICAYFTGPHFCCDLECLLWLVFLTLLAKIVEQKKQRWRGMKIMLWEWKKMFPMWSQNKASCPLLKRKNKKGQNKKTPNHKCYKGTIIRVIEVGISTDPPSQKEKEV